MIKLMTVEVNTTINGKPAKISKIVPMGTTGASRAVRVVFTSLQTIGGKKVASVNIPMPSSHRYSDMVRELTTGPKVGVIAQIISPSGKAMTFAGAYKKNKNKAGNNAK